MLFLVKYTSISFSKTQCLASSDQESSHLGLDACCLVVLEILSNRTPLEIIDTHTVYYITIWFIKKNLCFIFHTLGHCSVGGTRLGDFQRRWVSGEFRGGSRGSLDLLSGPKLFHFHREFKEICLKFGKRTPISAFEPPLQKSWIRPCGCR